MHIAAAPLTSAGLAFGVAMRGRVWKFGHDVDTDVMAPWGSIARPFEERRSQVLAMRPEFAAQVRPGDVVVAGRNWGCGSSREQAPENLQLLGVSVVLAESFGRIYFRNAIARAFPNLVCPGVWEVTEDGDEVEVDLHTATVTNHTRGWVLAAQQYTPEMLAIVQAGGLLAVLRQRVKDGRVLQP
ncbi:MAG: 3-isopropylmalate dehydratase small subunit [Acidimicrobiales bacterium]